MRIEVQKSIIILYLIGINIITLREIQFSRYILLHSRSLTHGTNGAKTAATVLNNILNSIFIGFKCNIF